MKGQVLGVDKIWLESLIPFTLHPVKTYQDERLEQLMLDIKEHGVKKPIIVRSLKDGKYEIICGHNCVKAVELLGYDFIEADVRYGMSDDEAQDLFYSTYLTPISFYNWDYLQKFRAVQYIEKVIRKNSRQGKRTDLYEKKASLGVGLSGVHECPRRLTTRDQMADKLDISTSTLSRYRSMVKLPDEPFQQMARLMDARLLTLEEAYRVSQLDFWQATYLLELCEEEPDKRIDLEQLKKFGTREGRKGTSLVATIAPRALHAVLVPRR